MVIIPHNHNIISKKVRVFVLRHPLGCFVSIYRDSSGYPSSSITLLSKVEYQLHRFGTLRVSHLPPLQVVACSNPKRVYYLQRLKVFFANAKLINNYSFFLIGIHVSLGIHSTATFIVLSALLSLVSLTM